LQRAVAPPSLLPQAGEKDASAMPILAGEGGEPIARSRKFYLAIKVPREQGALSGSLPVREALAARPLE